jgi:hypothetical protein
MSSKQEIARLIAHALQTDDPRLLIQAKNEVKCLGEALSKPVYWTGRQWAVTKHGIEARDGKYAIAGNRVWEEEDDYGWIRHMDEKGWVDMDDFAETLRIARKRWPRKSN